MHREGMAGGTHRSEALRELEIGRELRTRVSDDMPRALKRREFLGEGFGVVFDVTQELTRSEGIAPPFIFGRRGFQRCVWKQERRKGEVR